MSERYIISVSSAKLAELELKIIPFDIRGSKLSIHGTRIYSKKLAMKMYFDVIKRAKRYAVLLMKFRDSKELPTELNIRVTRKRRHHDEEVVLFSTLYRR